MANVPTLSTANSHKDELLALIETARLGKVIAPGKTKDALPLREGGLGGVHRKFGTGGIQAEVIAAVKMLFDGDSRAHDGLPDIVTGYFESENLNGDLETAAQRDVLLRKIKEAMNLALHSVGSFSNRQFSQAVRLELAPILTYLNHLSPTKKSNDPSRNGDAAHAGEKDGGGEKGPVFVQAMTQWTCGTEDYRHELVTNRFTSLGLQSFNDCLAQLKEGEIRILGDHEEITETDFFVIKTFLHDIQAGITQASALCKDKSKSKDLPQMVRRLDESVQQALGNAQRLAQTCAREYEKRELAHPPHQTLDTWMQSMAGALRSKLESLDVEKLTYAPDAPKGKTISVHEMVVPETHFFVQFRQEEGAEPFTLSPQERALIDDDVQKRHLRGKAITWDSKELELTADVFNRRFHGNLTDDKGMKVVLASDIQRTAEELEKPLRLKENVDGLFRRTKHELTMHLVNVLVEQVKQSTMSAASIFTLKNGNKLRLVGGTEFQIAWLPIIETVVAQYVDKLAPSSDGEELTTETCHTVLKTLWGENKDALLTELSTTVWAALQKDALVAPTSSHKNTLNFAAANFDPLQAAVGSPLDAQFYEGNINPATHARAELLTGRESEKDVELITAEDKYARAQIEGFCKEPKFASTPKTYDEIMQAFQAPGGLLTNIADYCNVVYHGGMSFRSAAGKFSELARSIIQQFPLASEDPSDPEIAFTKDFLGRIIVTEDDFVRKVRAILYSEGNCPRSKEFLRKLLLKYRPSVAPAPPKNATSITESPIHGSVQIMGAANVQSMKISENIPSDPLKQKREAALAKAIEYVQDNLSEWMDEDSPAERLKAEIAFVQTLQEQVLSAAPHEGDELRIRFMIQASAEQRVLSDYCTDQKFCDSLRGASVKNVALSIIDDFIRPIVYLSGNVLNVSLLQKRLAEILYKARQLNSIPDWSTHMQWRLQTSESHVQQERLPRRADIFDRRVPVLPSSSKRPSVTPTPEKRAPLSSAPVAPPPVQKLDSRVPELKWTESKESVNSISPLQKAPGTDSLPQEKEADRPVTPPAPGTEKAVPAVPEAKKSREELAWLAAEKFIEQQVHAYLNLELYEERLAAGRSICEHLRTTQLKEFWNVGCPAQVQLLLCLVAEKKALQRKFDEADMEVKLKQDLSRTARAYANFGVKNNVYLDKSGIELGQLAIVIKEILQKARDTNQVPDLSDFVRRRQELLAQGIKPANGSSASNPKKNAPPSPPTPKSTGSALPPRETISPPTPHPATSMSSTSATPNGLYERLRIQALTFFVGHPGPKIPTKPTAIAAQEILSRAVGLQSSMLSISVNMDTSLQALTERHAAVSAACAQAKTLTKYTQDIDGQLEALTEFREALVVHEQQCASLSQLRTQIEGCKAELKSMCTLIVQYRQLKTSPLGPLLQGERLSEIGIADDDDLEVDSALYNDSEQKRDLIDAMLQGVTAKEFRDKEDRAILLAAVNEAEEKMQGLVDAEIARLIAKKKK